MIPFWHPCWIKGGVMKTEYIHKMNTNHPKGEPGIDLIPGSYLLVNGSSEMSSPGSKLRKLSEDGPFLVTPASGSNLKYAENGQYMLVLEGSFYLRSADTMKSQVNLEGALGVLNVSSLENLRAEIGGGLFNLMIYRKDTRELTILNDRLALLPLFWIRQAGVLLLSNNQLNFQQLSSLSRGAVIEFFKFGYLPVSASLFEGVQRLGVDASLQINTVNGSITSNHYKVPAPAKLTLPSTQLAQHWKHAFDTYFSRMDTAAYLGLSGGYDSRLLAAYAAARGSEALNFGDENSSETRIAREIAQTLGIPLDRGQFPQNAITRYADRLRSEFRTPTTLENVHVLHLSETVEKKQAGLYLDGYLGGAIMGDVYYHKRGSNLKGVITYLLGREDFNTPAHSNDTYTNLLYSKDKQGLSDEVLSGILTQEDAQNLKARFSEFVKQWKQEGDNHEDLLERLMLLSRGRNLIANGPVSISTHTDTLIPFLDDAILDLSVQTPKKMRFAHGLYNKFWKIAFPAMAAIRKSGTFGKASDSDFAFRVKSILFVMYKHYIFPLIQKLTSSRQFREEEYFSTSWYLADEANASLVSQLMTTREPLFPQDIEGKIQADYTAGTLNQNLLMRYITLRLMLKGNS